MATTIVCYYNLAHNQGITMVLPVVINKTGEKLTKPDCHIWKKTLRCLLNLLIVEDRMLKRIIYGKVQPKLIAGYCRAGLFT